MSDTRRRAVGGDIADGSASPAVERVGFGVHTAVAAGLIPAVAADATGGGRARGLAVLRSRTCRVTTAAVRRRARGVDAGCAAIGFASSASIRALTVRANLARGAGGPARAAVRRIARSVHAGTVAACQWCVAGEPASARHANRRAVAGVDALLSAPSAVVEIGRRVDTARAAGRVAVITDDATVPRAHGLAVLGRGALKAATVAILGIAVQGDALSGAHGLICAAGAGIGSWAHANIRGNVAGVARCALTARALSTAQVRGQPALAGKRAQPENRKHDAQQRSTEVPTR